MFLPDTGSYGPGQTEGDFTSFFRVSRIVGSGREEQFAPDGRLKFPETDIANGVLSRDGCVDFRVKVIVRKSYYSMVQVVYQDKGSILPIAFSSWLNVGAVPLLFQDGVVYQGGTPLRVPVQLRVFFNGRPLWSEVVLVPIIDADSSIEVRRRLFVDASYIKFARHLGAARGGGACSTPIPSPKGPEEHNCPGLNKLSFSYDVPTEFNQLDLGLAAGIEVLARGTALSFSAMAPVYLATGCCRETQGYWDRSLDFPNTFANALRSSNIPAFLPPKVDQEPWDYVGGTIEDGAKIVVRNIETATKWFGFKWVHLIGHSKGGLNARDLLSRRLLENKGIGVRSLITLNTPHLGAVGADLVMAVHHGSLYWSVGVDNAVLMGVLTWKSWDEYRHHSQSDLTRKKVEDFNLMFPDPPAESVVVTQTPSFARAVARPIEVRAYVGDANADASEEPSNENGFFAWRYINSDEASGFIERDPDIPVNPDYLLSQLALWRFYNFLGRNYRVSFAPGTVSPNVLPEGFLLNDGTVTTRSQSYDKRPSFPPLTFGSEPVSGVVRGINGSNHASVAVAEKGLRVVQFYRELPR